MVFEKLNFTIQKNFDMWMSVQLGYLIEPLAGSLDDLSLLCFAFKFSFYLIILARLESSL